MRTILIYDDIFLKHNLLDHPENASRLKAFLKGAEKFSLETLKPKEVSFNILSFVHSENYIFEVKTASEEGRTEFLDPDTYITPFTYECAIRACGALELAVELVKEKEAEAVFCAVRPPGHHAERDRAMGFCIFNNVAIGAVKAKIEGYERVLIVDFDAHHGNGTQSFARRNTWVYYFSTHQYPFYPGTGGREENTSNIFNVPLESGSGDETFAYVYENTLKEFARKTEPHIIFVSAGYDIHKNDPLTGLNVSTEGVKRIIKSIKEVSLEAEVPVIFSLEGGYNLKALEECACVTFSVLLE